MENLYLVTRSTFERTAWQLAARLAKPGDTVCFIQDAVLAVNGPKELRGKLGELESTGVSVKYLAEDLAARGLSAPQEKVINYDGFVELIEKSKRIVS
ncbi:sulfurtransferase complex subunit TusB [candidate division WOR-3 bacterium]|nr:sulfurtransferase complex subunit TusB [candidate division WOR-3 bacterium]